MSANDEGRGRTSPTTHLSDLALSNAGVKLTDNGSLPKDKRQQKVFRRIINEMREGEKELEEYFFQINASKDEAWGIVDTLRQENAVLRDTVRKYQFATTLADMTDISESNKEKLLETTVK